MNPIRKKMILAGTIKPANEDEMKLLVAAQVAAQKKPTSFLIEIALVNLRGHLHAAGALHTPGDLKRFLLSACEGGYAEYYLPHVEEILVHPYGRNNGGDIQYVLSQLCGKGRLVSKEEIEKFEEEHRTRTGGADYDCGDLEGSPVAGVSLTDAYGIYL